jgi:hypothetical protein
MSLRGSRRKGLYRIADCGFRIADLLKEDSNDFGIWKWERKKLRSWEDEKVGERKKVRRIEERCA